MLIINKNKIFNKKTNYKKEPNRKSGFKNSNRSEKFTRTFNRTFELAEESVIFEARSTKIKGQRKTY